MALVSQDCAIAEPTAKKVIRAATIIRLIVSSVLWRFEHIELRLEHRLGCGRVANILALLAPSIFPAQIHGNSIQQPLQRCSSQLRCAPQRPTRCHNRLI
jgi:hypothetical protein